MADKLRKETEKENRLIREGLYKAAADPTKTFITPAPKAEVPYFNFAPLQNALASLQKSTTAFEKARKNVLAVQQQAALNQALMGMEQQLLRKEGLPRRSWYKHHIYAPGFYTGYGVKTLPGIREAIEERQYEEAQEQILILAEVLASFTRQIDQATALLQQGQPPAEALGK